MTDAHMEPTHLERNDSGYSVSGVPKDEANSKKIDVADGIDKLINLVTKQAKQISKLEQENDNQKKDLKNKNKTINQLKEENEEKDRLIAELELQINSLTSKNEILKRSSHIYTSHEE